LNGRVRFEFGFVAGESGPGVLAGRHQHGRSMRTVYYYYKDDNMDQTLGDYLTNALASARNEVPGAPLMRAAGRRD
jgi:hypothetical protein